ncbi:MAG: nuclear transport factor 2 family protein [Actinomycetota bacterium]
MSQENVEIFRRAFKQFTREGWEPLMGTVWDSEIVWNMSPTGIPGLGTYRGFDELRSFFEDWFGAFPFEEWEQELDEVIDCGEQIVVALTRQRGHGSTSGAVTQLEYAQVIKFRGGKVVEVDIYLDRARALEAAGLSE